MPGNTCYMNSALQCLVHCQELTEYFLRGEFTVNRSNPLGMNGQLAESYADLVRALFNPNCSKPYSAINFKRTMDKFAPNFETHTQEDSLDFLSFLLDGLHEDLNCVVERKYSQRMDMVALDPSQEQLEAWGRMAWEAHKLRNDSKVVDLCHGMSMCSNICPDCNETSVTFQAFNDLGLPLPVRTTYTGFSMKLIE